MMSCDSVVLPTEGLAHGYVTIKFQAFLTSCKVCRRMLGVLQKTGTTIMMVEGLEAIEMPADH